MIIVDQNGIGTSVLLAIAAGPRVLDLESGDDNESYSDQDDLVAQWF